MKNTVIILLMCWQGFFFSTQVMSQAEWLPGTWEGTFMEQFQIRLVFELSAGDIFQGTILLFQGEQKLQDDPLAEISVQHDSLSFKIPAKETTFSGLIDRGKGGLTGQFVFPDGSRHPVVVRKTPTDRGYLADEVLDREKLRQDLRLLLQMIREHHPAPYRHLDEAGFDELFQQLTVEVAQMETVNAFFLLASQLTDAVRCSHTGLRMADEWYMDQEEKNVWFPCELQWVDNRLLMLKSYSGEDLIPPGSEIVAINGRSATEIIQSLYHFIPAESWNQTTKPAFLNRDFAGYYVLLDPEKTFEVDYQTSQSTPEHKVILEGVTKALLDEKKGNYPVKEPGLEFAPEKEHNLALLAVPSFAIPDLEAYLTRLEDIFQQLNRENIDRLIIDLRGNSGGHPFFAAALFSCLAEKSFTWFDGKYGISPEFEPLYHPMDPAPWSFTGEVYLLTDGRCLSSTGHFIAHCQLEREAILAGEMPGSYAACNDNSVEMQLPYSRISVNLPRQTFAVPCKEDSLQLTPRLDLEIDLTFEERLSGEDGVKERLEEVLKNKER